MLEPRTLTLLLERVAEGDSHAAGELLPLVYDELRAMAGAKMRHQPGGHTLQATALVHDLYLKLVSAEQGYVSRSHFMAVAATAMRQLLTDHARRKRAMKRGGEGAQRVDVEPDQLASEAPIDVVALDDALTKLAAMDGRRHRVVELRFLGGLTVDEAAEVMGVSRSTVESDWRAARAWLAVELGG